METAAEVLNRKWPRLRELYCERMDADSLEQFREYLGKNMPDCAAKTATIRDHYIKQGQPPDIAVGQFLLRLCIVRAHKYSRVN